jgi:AraC-like DNA-binding protein
MNKGGDIPIEEVESFYQDISTLPLKDGNGNLICVVNVLITKRKLKDRTEISLAKQYLEKHWLEKFDIKKAAKAAYLSPAHFSRMFREHTGLTPRQYYVLYKIDRLQEYLLDTNLSIAQAFKAPALKALSMAFSTMVSFPEWQPFWSPLALLRL